MTCPFFISIPHSGEEIPPEIKWLKGLPEPTVMRDVDRYVDRLYEPALLDLGIPHIIAKWHRYFCDLNRSAEDVDAGTVVGSPNASGVHRRGLLWAITTKGEPLLKEPISQDLYKKILKDYFQPFHDSVESQYRKFHQQGFERVYHLDAHSMPSLGTKEHRDPGEQRAEIVVSDQKGKSCRPEFLAIVTRAYQDAGFEVKTNWPYLGGRITEAYGDPQKGHHTIQVELNRRLYMNEDTKQILPQHKDVSGALKTALEEVIRGIQNLEPPPAFSL